MLGSADLRKVRSDPIDEFTAAVAYRHFYDDAIFIFFVFRGPAAPLSLRLNFARRSTAAPRPLDESKNFCRPDYFLPRSRTHPQTRQKNKPPVAIINFTSTPTPHSQPIRRKSGIFFFSKISTRLINLLGASRPPNFQSHFFFFF